MEKIAIIGSPGSGKTTLAMDLGRIFNITVVHLDRLFWQRNWQRIPEEKRLDILQELIIEMRLNGKGWIIEGSYLCPCDLHLQEADTIIFLDIPALVCLWRLFERHFKTRGQPRRDLPNDCTDRLTLSCIRNVLAFPFRGRKMILQHLHDYEEDKFKQFNSAKQVESFLAQQKRDVKEKNLLGRDILTTT